MPTRRQHGSMQVVSFTSEWPPCKCYSFDHIPTLGADQRRGSKVGKQKHPSCTSRGVGQQGESVFCEVNLRMSSRNLSKRTRPSRKHREGLGAGSWVKRSQHKSKALSSSPQVWNKPGPTLGQFYLQPHCPGLQEKCGLVWRVTRK